MKIFVIGKIDSITHWLEDSVAAFRAEGHQVRIGVTRNPKLSAALESVLLAPWLGAPLASRIGRQIAAFCPDLVLAIGAHAIPPIILEHIAALRGRPRFVGWVGDVFGREARRSAAALDVVAYTDSGLVELHARLGFTSPAIYLPHAANPHIDVSASREVRQARMVFVGHPSPRRLEVIGALRSPISLYGTGWTPFARVEHEIHRRRVAKDDLQRIYAGHVAALNIRNERNVIHGLNQRNFDPYLTETAVIAEDQPDLARCFETGREVLVWRDIDELNDIYERVRRAPDSAASVGRLGRRRVLADHTYARRLEALTKLL